VDTGIETNMAPGTVLKWSAPPPGSNPEAIVLDDGGDGLTGGGPAQTTEDHKVAIQEALRTPAAAGNDADYQLSGRDTVNVPVEQVFTWSAILGPATIGVSFTTTPDSAGSRIPNASQIANVAARLESEFPADDGIAMCVITYQDVDVIYRLTWKSTTRGWFSSPAWPPFRSTGNGPYAVDGTYGSTTALACRITSTGTVDPEVGDVVGFWDATNRKFVRKEIATVTGSASPWVVTFEEDNGASDLEYVPVAAQRVLPWSDSLPKIVQGIVDAFSALGPGEQTASFLEDGRRRRRSPFTEDAWPSEITTSALQDAVKAAGVTQNHRVVEGDGTDAAVGTPGIEAFMLRLNYLSVYPE
jgi:hypothetical protein